jgi:DNA-binding MarR family transcriptional regulator
MPRQPGPVPTIISVVRRAAALMTGDLVARLDAAGFAGLTPAHQAVFENLDPGGTRLTELAARAGITRQSMSELVSVLEQRGYLERRPDPSDGRARIVRLTPTGRKMARRAIKEMAAIEAEWRKRLTRQGLLHGDIVAAFTQALATQQPRPAAAMAGTARPEPPTST